MPQIPIMPGTMDLLTRMGDAFLTANKLLLLVLQRASNEVRCLLVVILIVAPC
jgi:hypothetical protein